ncbi:short-chain dehydrogenase/reductase SDR [Salinisphaera hydrothermalis C41B8]|uniref:Short-chain dehydrogenase/reductase SDR n=1 Tax=Salinisphaera hydrothermalis (strain C41B8) TaxID=1304275 RepID=A0A084IPM0_SALHC|nr:short-chain dehydrogenase/reductase SDR [Salinisphaera hydrothermalis C41B8]
MALVTGGSRGIGAATARRLGADGFAVLVNYAGRADKADDVVATIRQAGGHAVAVQGDVSVPADVARLFDAAEAEFGGLDVLVNSAGVIELAPIGEMSDADFDRIVAINLKGTFNTLREASRRLRPGGRIINLSTGVTRLLRPGYGAYAASKAAVEALTGVLTKEMRGRDIRVNAVAPGPTATELFFDGKSDALVDEIARLSPLERLGQPDEIAAVIAMLASDSGAWVNGQTIHVNGGMV